jgi:hypothetical protein
VRRKALRQLKVSDRISAESRQRSDAAFNDLREMVQQTLAGHMAPRRMSIYIETVLNGLADITIEAIAANPKKYEHFSQAGFDLYWKGTGT